MSSALFRYPHHIADGNSNLFLEIYQGFRCQILALNPYHNLLTECSLYENNKIEVVYRQCHEPIYASGLFYHNYLDRSISNAKSVWIYFYIYNYFHILQKFQYLMSLRKQVYSNILKILPPKTK